MEILAIQMRQKEPENPDTPLKGPRTDSVTRTHSPWVLAAQEAQETNRERLSSVALGARAGGTAALVLLLGPLQGRLQMGAIMPVLGPPPAQSI